MKALAFLLFVAAIGMISAAPHATAKRDGSAAEQRSAPDRWEARSATANLAALVDDLRAGDRQEGSEVRRSAGDLWLEVGRLKRAGEVVRPLEWQVSEVEESLRRGSLDTAARRHRLNDLEYEIERLARRQR